MTARVKKVIDEMAQLSALRGRNIRIANPPERAPKWDVETVA